MSDYPSHLLTSKAFLDLDACLAKGEIPSTVVAAYKEKFSEVTTTSMKQLELERDALSRVSTKSVQLDDTHDAIDRGKRELFQSQEALNLLEAELSDAQASLTEQKLRDALLSEQLAELASRKALAESELISAQEANLATVEPVLRGLEEEIEEASAEGASTRVALEASEVAVTNLRRKGGNLRKVIEKHTTSLNSLKEELASAGMEPGKVALLLAGVERVFLSISGESGQVEQEVGQLRESVTAQQEAMTSSARELSVLHTRLTAHCSEVETREREVAGLEAVLSGEKAQGKELLERRVTLEGDKGRLYERLGVAKAALASASTVYERVKRELARRREVLNETKQQKGPLEVEIKSRTSALAAAEADAAKAAVTREGLKREMDALVAAYLREEAVEKRERQAVDELAAESNAAEAERDQWAIEEKTAAKQLAALKAARDLKKKEVLRVEVSTRDATNVAEAKEALLVEAKASSAEFRSREALALALHKAALAERSAHLAAQVALASQLEQLEETRKVLGSELVTLEGEKRSKARVLKAEQASLKLLSEEQCNVREKVNKMKSMEEEVLGELHSAKLAKERLLSGVALTKREAERVRREMSGLAYADARAVALKIDSESVEAICREKIKAQEWARDNGEPKLAKVKEEIRVLESCKKKLEAKLAWNIKRIKGTGSGSTEELKKLEAEAKSIWTSVEALGADVTSTSRLKYLEGDDPEMNDLRPMVDAMEARLSNMHGNILKMEVALESVKEAKEGFLREAEGRDGGKGAVAGAREVNTLAQRVRDASRLLMAGVAELSLMQAMEIKAEGEAESARAARELGEKRFESGQPPSDAAVMKLGTVRRASALIVNSGIHE